MSLGASRRGWEVSAVAEEPEKVEENEKEEKQKIRVVRDPYVKIEE